MSGTFAAPAEVVVVGSLNMDLCVRAVRLPRPGETVIGSDFATYAGGKGANQAVAAARLGARVAMVGRVGADPHGQRLRDALQRERIDDAAVGVDPVLPTGVAAIVVANDGENSIVVAPGANHALTAAHVDACAALIGAARIVVLQLEIGMPAVDAALRRARSAGVTTLLNAAPIAPLSSQQIAAIDWLVVNETEAASLAGQPVDDVAQACAVAALLRARGARQVVVTLGPAGLVHASGAAVTHLAAPVADVVDTTGAGDTFVGALAATLAHGLAPVAALRWGQAAAAVAVTRHGAQPAMPTRAELLARWADPARDL